MSAINLELQLKFLNDLEAALEDALVRYGSEEEAKLAELKLVRGEVDNARRVVAARLAREARQTPKATAAGSGHMATGYRTNILAG